MIFPKGNSSHHLKRMGEFLQTVVKRPRQCPVRGTAWVSRGSNGYEDWNKSVSLHLPCLVKGRTKKCNYDVWFSGTVSASGVDGIAGSSVPELKSEVPDSGSAAAGSAVCSRCTAGIVSPLTLIFRFTFASYVCAFRISLEPTPVASDMVSNTCCMTAAVFPEISLTPLPFALLPWIPLIY